MKKVLIITYYWPPSGGAGVQRWLKFTKYLPEFGWKPIVLTVKNGTYPTIDDSLLEDVDEHTEVHATKTREPFAIYNSLLFKKRKASVSTGLTGIKNSKNPIKKWAQYVRANYMIPDARKGWNQFAIREAKKIIQEQNIEVVVTTGPPHSSHLIGEALKKTCSIQWVADLRDPWTTVYYNKMLPRTKKTEQKDKAIENRVLAAADCISVVGDQFKNEFPNHADKIKVIYNGFDESDIDTSIQPTKTDYFTLAYIGNFKPNQSVPVLWKAVQSLLQENEQFKNYFRLQFVGAIDPKEKNYLEENLSDHLQLEGFVSHDQAVKAMQSASLLLFVIPNIDNNNLIITGKVFEYLATHSPLLSIGPKKGNAAQIIDTCDRQPMLDYIDYEAIKSALLDHFNRWFKNDQTKVFVKSDQLQQYTRQHQTQKLSNLLETLNS